VVVDRNGAPLTSEATGLRCSGPRASAPNHAVLPEPLSDPQEKRVPSPTKASPRRLAAVLPRHSALVSLALLSSSSAVAPPAVFRALSLPKGTISVAVVVDPPHPGEVAAFPRRCAVVAATAIPGERWVPVIEGGFLASPRPSWTNSPDCLPAQVPALPEAAVPP